MVGNIRASAATHIDRDVEHVFAYVSNLATYGAWVSGVEDATPLDGANGSLGDRYVFDYAYGGRTTEMTVEIAAIDPPHSVDVVALEGPFPYESTVTVEPAGDGVRVRYAIEVGSDGRFTSATFALLGPVLKRVTGRRLSKDLAHLKRILEARDEDDDHAPDAGRKSVTMA
jgi:carbon monoxide dehydrogenase subunit G